MGRKGAMPLPALQVSDSAYMSTTIISTVGCSITDVPTVQTLARDSFGLPLSRYAENFSILSARKRRYHVLVVAGMKA